MTQPPDAPGLPPSPEEDHLGYVPSHRHRGAAQYPPPGTEPFGPEPRKRHTKLIVGVIAAVLVAAGVVTYLLVSSGSGAHDSPRAAVASLLQAANKGDTAAMRDSLCASNRVLAQVVGQVFEGHLEGYTLGRVVTADSTHARVHVTIRTGFGTAPYDLSVVKEDGKWLVCVSDLFGRGPTAAAPSPSG